MTTIILPNWPPPFAVTPRYQSTRETYRSPVTGAAQVNDRLGDFIGIEVSLPPMVWDDARKWISKLAQGLGNTVNYEWPQPGFDAGSPGTVRVNGAGQTGKALIVDGFAGAYQPLEGQFFSVVTASGRAECKVLTGDPALTSGAGTLHFTPRLHFSPGDNVLVSLAPAYIEGNLVDDSAPWAKTAGGEYQISFKIDEA